MVTRDEFLSGIKERLKEGVLPDELRRNARRSGDGRPAYTRVERERELAQVTGRALGQARPRSCRLEAAGPCVGGLTRPRRRVWPPQTLRRIKKLKSIPEDAQVCSAWR